MNLGRGVKENTMKMDEEVRGTLEKGDKVVAQGRIVFQRSKKEKDNVNTVLEERERIIEGVKNEKGCRRLQKQKT